MKKIINLLRLLIVIAIILIYLTQERILAFYALFLFALSLFFTFYNKPTPIPTVSIRVVMTSGSFGNFFGIR